MMDKSNAFFYHIFPKGTKVMLIILFDMNILVYTNLSLSSQTIRLVL